MPTYIITETPSEDVKLYISQSPLECLIEALRSFYLRSARFKIFELRPVAINAEFNPKECVSLALVAKCEPHDKQIFYGNLWGHELDDLPPEQQAIEITRMLDYIDQKRRQHSVQRQTTTTSSGSNIDD